MLCLHLLIKVEFHKNKYDVILVNKRVAEWHTIIIDESSELRN